MNSQLSKKYLPHDIEKKWMGVWESSGVYAAEEEPKGEPYCIVIPPPNVTGVLHMGHALNNTLQDILIRYYRMQGRSALWVFGMDHAGIATQNVVERQLSAEGLSRFDLGREEFVKRVWKWKEQSGGQIRNQLKKLGSSLDYGRERFTMDEGLSEAVREVFVKLYEEGLIYRGERLINWCPRCHTALSDLEVEHEEIKGHLWHMRYALADEKGFLVVATTRPETMLGDSAVAVHPDDERYKVFVGKYIQLPFTDRKIPIIADTYVDQTFGSGAVKITPAHDFNDFEMGHRHGLLFYNVFDENGCMNEQTFDFRGQDRFECRKQLVRRLTEEDLLEKIEDYPTNVGHCYRCKTIVEPYLSKQWFVKTAALAKPATEAVRCGKTRIVPTQWENTYFRWMEEIRDWCISRQIWWGHRIPAWYCQAQLECPPIVVRYTPKVCSQCGGKDLVQETDVLDTWFSSALWPFSTLGWPNSDSKLLKNYYPTQTLVTGFDIIFFWVARMMMMGLYFMGDVPFKEVYIHALVRDAQGQKMSKSKGNVMDPLFLMEKYGTDAFRFTLVAFAAQGRDVKLSEDRIEGYRNFCNKLWNAARFILTAALPYAEQAKETDIQVTTDVDAWILKEYYSCVSSVRKALEQYRFNEAALTLYHFFWGTYCDWYLEFIKTLLYKEDDKKATATLAVFILDHSLRLLHPFVPFISEEIWQMLFDRKGKLLTQAAYPEPKEDLSCYEEAASRVNQLQKVVSKIRQIRTETGLSPAKQIDIYLYSSEGFEKEVRVLEGNIKELSKVETIKYVNSRPKEPVAKGVVGVGDLLVFVPLEGLIDLSKEEARQQKELKKTQKGIDALSRMLNSPQFSNKAPPDLVAQKKQESLELEQRRDEIEEAIVLLKG